MIICNKVTTGYSRAQPLLKDFNANYLELISQQRESLVSERDSLMAEVNREVEKAKITLFCAKCTEKFNKDKGLKYIVTKLINFSQTLVYFPKI